MSFEQRVRDGLRGMSSSIDEPNLAPLLHDAIGRGRHRRRIRKVASAMVAIFVLVGAAYAAHAARRVDRVPISPPVAPGMVTTVVGNGVGHSRGDGGPAVDAAILKPVGIVLDEEGNLYVAEGLPRLRIRKVDASGLISTLAGSHARGAAALDIVGPAALAIDGHGNLYIAGGPSGDATSVFTLDRSGTVTRVAGTDGAGYSGDGGPTTRAEFDSISDVAVDEEGRLYIVDLNNARIRMVNERGVVETIAGTGQPGFSGDGGLATEAEIDATSICLDPQGGIVISGGEHVRRIDPRGIITTVAGSSSAAAGSEARILDAGDVACDRDGNIYVSDSVADRILKIDPSGSIDVVAGTGGRGFGGDGGPPGEATFAGPASITIGPDGALYVCDLLNNRVRRITLEGGSVGSV
jgi:sugar lactone lactonase YvrE